MNERVAFLREKSQKAEPQISLERAELITQAYKKYAGKVSTPVLRALAFRHLMENKTIYIGDKELIVGERGPAPKATPTYPEICCHSIEDLKLIDERDKIWFKVREEDLKKQKEVIIPFWRDKSMRTRIFQEMNQKWQDCYEAGIFTEFMEQRAPGHTVADEKIFKYGFIDFQKRIEKRIKELAKEENPKVQGEIEQLKAMSICAEAIITFAQRHGEILQEMAEKEESEAKRAELMSLSRICFQVPARPPQDFQEALQAYWFIHLGVITELNTWDSFNPGRLDQHLYPFYRKGLEEGALTRERAKELLQCFWIKFNNQPAPPKVGVTLQESSTYTDFANINIGGLKPDGRDGVNQVSLLLLEVVDEMKLTQPSSNIQLSKKNPQHFLLKACQVIRKGWGQPSVFNADAVVAELLRQGKTIEDARSGGTSGCVETGAFGKESYILTGYFNLVKVLEITLNNGMDPRTGKEIGVVTGEPETFQNFQDLLTAFKTQLNHFIDIKIGGNNVIERLYSQHMPSPFLSILIDDCIEKGRDYNAGGARYNTTYIQGVGIGTITDSLSAIKHHVYQEHNLSMAELLKALKNNFQGFEKLRQLLLNKTPRYGNDDNVVDDIMVEVFESFFQAVEGRPNVKGGKYSINMLPTTCHVYFGSVIGATSDGRKAARPLSEGISPVQGADRNGPTAVIKSASKMDHLKTGGTLLNQKFTPKLLEGEVGLQNLANLIRAYFRLDGHHIQFNVISAQELRKAQENPEEYRDLIVRVAGYSDYYCHLEKDLQDEIILRTEHQGF